ncbi:MAG: 2-phosphosulfolactate phosphatase [Candidatus Binatia bacterium]
MPRTINVHLLPSLVAPVELTGKVVVVIDVLRATTTIVYALAAGAVEVIPCLEVDEALLLAGQNRETSILGGERGGRKIENFDLGNSPLDYTPAKVGGKSVVFTTTNGTRALMRCRSARRLVISAFVNFSAVCRALAEEDAIEIVCAGTDGEVTREDTLLAGAIVDELLRVANLQINDQAEIAADAWRSAIGDLTGQSPLSNAMRRSRGGRNLIEIGQENDIDIAAQIDRFDIVPELDLAAWRIRA